MTILHTINKSPATGLFSQCSALLRSGDAVLFLEDGTYHCCEPQLLENIKQDVTIYYLKEDLVARGLMNKVEDHANLASYRKFVELCAKHDKTVSWF